jgi:hypothetical protein
MEGADGEPPDSQAHETPFFRISHLNAPPAKKLKNIFKIG